MCTPTLGSKLLCSPLAGLELPVDHAGCEFKEIFLPLPPECLSARIKDLYHHAQPLFVVVVVVCLFLIQGFSV